MVRAVPVVGEPGQDSGDASSAAGSPAASAAAARPRPRPRRAGLLVDGSASSTPEAPRDAAWRLPPRRLPPRPVPRWRQGPRPVPSPSPVPRRGRPRPWREPALRRAPRPGGGGIGLAPVFFAGAGRVGRSGLGDGPPVGTATPNRVAIWGMSDARRVTVAVSSSLTCDGGAAAVTCARTGENAAASRTAAQTVRCSVGGERRRGGLGQAAGDLGRETHARLGRLSRHLERPDHTTDTERSVDVLEPVLVLALLLGDERGLQFVRDLTGRLVTRDDGIVAGGDDRAQVAEVEFLEVLLRRVGTVEPLGDAQLRQQFLAILSTPASGISACPPPWPARCPP